MNIVLGNTYTDRITGFTGIAVGHCEYLTGCNQTLLSPRGSDSGKRPESEWFDDQRLEINLGVEPFELDNGATPGCDKAAPRI